MGIYKTFVLLLLIFFVQETTANAKYSRLIKKLKNKLNPDAIPLGRNKESVNVTIAFALNDIVKADADNRRMVVEVLLTYRWNAGITWPRDKFDFDSVRFPSKDIWVPDLNSYNGYEKFDNQIEPSLVVLNQNGDVVWVIKTRIDFKCKLSPQRMASNETCVYTIGSWTHNGNEIYLSDGGYGVDVSEFSSAKYKLLEATVETKTVHYACCPEPYMNCELTLSFRRKHHHERLD